MILNSAAVKQRNLLDFRGMMSFVGLLEVSRTFDEMKPGQVLEILINDNDAITDIDKLLLKGSYEMTVRKVSRALSRIRIKKIVTH